MRKQQFNQINPSGLLGEAHWLLAVKPERGKNDVSISFSGALNDGRLPFFIVDIDATSGYNVPALTAKGLALLVEKEAEYRQETLKVVSV